MASATWRADWYAASTLTSAPTLPSGPATVPPSPMGKCPARQTRLPTTRTVSKRWFASPIGGGRSRPSSLSRSLMAMVGSLMRGLTSIGWQLGGR